MTDKELLKVDRKFCVHYEGFYYGCYCNYKASPIDEPISKNQFFEYYIKCPCKTYFKSIDEAK